jgi:parvulin-like peptidyl-prolyl isomerase
VTPNIFCTLFIAVFLAMLAETSCAFASRPDSGVAGECKEGKVTTEELSKAVDRTVRQIKRISPDKVFTPGEMADLEASTLTDLLLRKIFLRMAEKEKLQVLDSEVKERYFIVCSGLFDNDEKAFIKALNQDGWTEAEYMQNLREIIISEKMRARVTGDIDVPETECRAYYNAHQPEFEVEEMELAHLLVAAPERDAPERDLKTIRTGLLEKKVPPESLEVKAAEELDKRRAKIDALLDSAKKGADFAGLARRHSEDGTREQGGSLGWVARGRMVKPFEDAAFALSKGQFSGVVRTEFGFHVIKALSDPRKRLQDFSEVEMGISSRMRADREAEKISALEKKWKVRKYGIIKKGTSHE